MSEQSYGKLVSEASGCALGLEEAINETSPRTVPELVAEELPHLQALTEHLEKTECPVEVKQAHERLVGGLRTFQDELMDVSEEASIAASQGDVYQSGLLFSHIDVVESGGRMRWELAQSHGLAAVREALRDLNSAGFTQSGVG
jgi:hypothetical protein